MFRTANVGLAGILVLVLIAVSNGFPYNEISSDKELRLLHVVMRHGIRTPVSTYPKDPYIKHKFEPNGWGQLTNAGILDLQNFGIFLRTRYDKFLGTHYNNSEYYCQSTGVERALSSIMAVNSGLWKPNSKQTWNKNLEWLPIPVFSEPLDDDMLLLVRKDCPQYSIELKKVENSQEIQNKIAEYKELFKFVQDSTGQKMENFYDIEDVFTTLLAEQAYGLELPSWTKGYFPEQMKDPASMSFVLKAYNDKLKRLKGGVLLKKLVNDWTKKADGSSPNKMFLYGGHDTTISNLLSALNIFDPQVPNYGMAVITELKFDRTLNQFGIEIFVRNSTDSLHQMQLPGCEVFCPLEKVLELTKNVIPIDWNTECSTDDPNYIPSKPLGP